MASACPALLSENMAKIEMIVIADGSLLSSMHNHEQD